MLALFSVLGLGCVDIILGFGLGDADLLFGAGKGSL